MALHARGLGVRTARYGKRALSLVQELQPALVLLDLELPDIDGYQVLEAIKREQRTADIPVIVMTRSVTDTNGKEQELRALGALRFLTTPFSMEELAEEISHLTEETLRVDGKVAHKE